MLCRNPFVTGGAGYGCGQCFPCRVKRRRIWVHRILLEGMLYPNNSFVTLTYADEKLPDGMSLRLYDLQLFLKRLRSRLSPDKVRYFAVGEYGEQEGRPHYHLALFNYVGCVFGDYFVYSGQRKRECMCLSCSFIRHVWSNGRIHQGVIERKSAQYIAGYTVKGMTRHDDERLGGKEPEFARMSLRPGIGADAMCNVARTIECYKLAADGDVTSALRNGSRILPLGRYLRERLRLRVGTTDEQKAVSLEDWRKELSELREVAKALSDDKVYKEGSYNEEIFKKLLIEQDMVKVRQMEMRQKLYERGKK